MFIITKTTAAARPVSLEQIAAMVIVQQRFGFITDFCWRQRCLLLSNCCRKKSVFPKTKPTNNLHNISSMNQTQRRKQQQDLQLHRHHNQQQHYQQNYSQPFTVIAAIIVALALFVNCPAFVVAEPKTATRSIATGSHENDHNRLHANWLEYQRQTLRPRATQSTAGTTTSGAAAAGAATANNNYLSPELGNIFTQLGIFIQARQRNATEIAQHIFFKYYNT